MQIVFSHFECNFTRVFAFFFLFCLFCFSQQINILLPHTPTVLSKIGSLYNLPGNLVVVCPEKLVSFVLCTVTPLLIPLFS